jgi:RecA-family ATPase
MKKLEYRTAKAICDSTPEEPDWIAKPWIVRSSITELVGKAKEAGKTTWLMSMISAVLNGSKFLGNKCQKSHVVYLTEELTPTFKEALKRANLTESERFHIATRDKTTGITWQSLIAQSVETCLAVKAKLFIVDTISQYANLQGDAENDAGAVLKAFKVIQNAAAAGLGVIVVRHERKSSGNVGDSGRGSTAFTGAVDVVISYKKPRKIKRDTVRHITTLSRFNETPRSMFIDWDENVFHVYEHGVDTKKWAEEAILKVLPADEKEALSEKKLLDLTKLRRTTGMDAIQELLGSGKLIRLGKGVRNSPYKYMRKSNNGKKTKRHGGPTSFFNKKEDKKAVAAN